MFSDRFASFVERGLSLMASLFVLGIGLVVIGIILLYIYDKTQRQHAILRNFPVLGHLRYVFEDMGIFFRQYFFAADREELPFNRAQRGWVYQAAKDVDNTVAFGSTRLLTPLGTVMFVNGLFPTLRADATDTKALTFGPNCEHPYTTSSLFNISAMSFGAISKPAVLALSNGAKKAGCWLNTGEGGLSSYHLVGGCDIVFQIGTAKYGVRNADGGLDHEKLRAVAAHDEVKMFEMFEMFDRCAR